MNRIHALDITRGFSMFFICGGEWILLTLCACFPTHPYMTELRAQLGHVAWEGFTFLDLIFPTFLLISGASFTFSWQRQIAQGLSTRSRWQKLALRTLFLIILGIIYNGALQQTSLEMIRYPSVLARIGLGVFLAAIPYTLLSPRWRWTFFPIGLLVYTLLFTLWDSATPYAQGDNLAEAIDALLLPGVTENGVKPGLDAEGIVTTFGASLTATIGMLLGDFLRTDIKRKPLWILLAGLILLGTAYAMGPWAPVIKRLWTAGYICMAGGWTLLIVTVFYLLADTCRWYRAFLPLTFIGMHALTFYLLARFVDFRIIAWQFISGPANAFIADKAILDLLYATAGFILLWTLIRWFYSPTNPFRKH